MRRRPSHLLRSPCQTGCSLMSRTRSRIQCSHRCPLPRPGCRSPALRPPRPRHPGCLRRLSRTLTRGAGCAALRCVRIWRAPVGVLRVALQTASRCAALRRRHRPPGGVARALALARCGPAPAAQSGGSHALLAFCQTSSSELQNLRHIVRVVLTQRRWSPQTATHRPPA